MNYRNAFEFNEKPPLRNPQKPNDLVFVSVNELNISVTALYLIAGMKRDDQQKARLAVIEAARGGRVTYQRARSIVADTETASKPALLPLAPVLAPLVEPARSPGKVARLPMPGKLEPKSNRPGKPAPLPPTIADKVEPHVADQPADTKAAVLAATIADGAKPPLAIDTPAPLVADALIDMFGLVKAGNIARLIAEKVATKKPGKSAVQLKADAVEAMSRATTLTPASRVTPADFPEIPPSLDRRPKLH